MAPKAIKERLEQAADVIRRLPAPRPPQGYESQWPDVLKETSESYGYGTVKVRPSPPQGREIDDAWEAYGWLGYLEIKTQRMVWARANNAPWWRMAQQYKCSERTVQRKHNVAIERIGKGLAARARKNS